VTVSGGVRLFGQVVPVDGNLPAPGVEVRALLRPEAVLVEPINRGSEDESGSRDATVITATFFGAVTRLRMTQPDGQEILADVGSHRSPEFPAGARVRISVLDRPVLVRPPDAADVS
jgi:putative spermidine/putrescine transport system ATP-binding protein